MSRAGQVVENRVTGERAVVRIGTEETDGELLVVDLYVRPGGAVVGEHIHPNIEERFMVMHGKVGFRLNGQEQIAEIGNQLVVAAGVAHDWWNAGEDEAHVVVEVRPGVRFEEMVVNLFGLANDGKTNSQGMPHLLQLVAFGHEFSDVLYFTHPPRIIQKLISRVLLPLAHLLGYRGSYTKYMNPSSVPELNPEALAQVPKYTKSTGS